MRLPEAAVGTSPEDVVEVGVDLAAVAEVAAAVDRLGPRYLHRLFTDHEVASCGGEERLRTESLAARFAAKEAVLKVLRPSGARPEWRDIEVVRHPDGSCDVRLHGEAATLAAEREVAWLSLSMSHEAGLAVAVVAATRRTACPSVAEAGATRGEG